MCTEMTAMQILVTVESSSNVVESSGQMEDWGHGGLRVCKSASSSSLPSPCRCSDMPLPGRRGASAVGQLPQCRGCDVPLGPGPGGIPSFRLVPADCSLHCLASAVRVRACMCACVCQDGRVPFLLRLPQPSPLAPPAVWLTLNTSSLPACPTALPRTSTSSCASVLSACALPTLWSALHGARN